MTWQPFAHTKDTCHPLLARGDGLPVDQPLMKEAPPWRRFMPWEDFQNHHAEDACRRWRNLQAISSRRAEHKARSFFLPERSTACQELVLAVNAALALRRPLLLTGLPGSGKTSLAFVIADWLGLGPVLEWPVSPGALLADALSTYNPLARLRDLETRGETTGEPRAERPVEDYVRLGPVGTAFLPAPLPRVLLIDEIDKGDLNLANELLHLFEEGRFSIPELQRAERDRTPSSEQGSSDQGPSEPQMREVEIWDEVEGRPLKSMIRGGQVQCHEFPLVVMSSNGEREFPPAFHRRCLRLEMPDFSSDGETMKRIVQNHFEADLTEASVDQALELFKKALKKNRNDLATDQLLNLAYLINHNLGSNEQLRAILLKGLSGEAGSGAPDDSDEADEDDEDNDADEEGT